MRAFVTYVRPLLEYATPVWTPHHVYLVFKLEGVQRKFTKRLSGLNNLSYKDRLLVLGVDTLERRRLFYDLSLFYKVVHGFVDLSLNFDLRGTTSSRNTRGHDLKLRKELCKSDVAKFFFSNRVCDVWNSLNSHIVNSPSVSVFKFRIKSADLVRFLVIH